MDCTHFKLEIFVPGSHLEAVRQALFAVDAGHIGRYDHCLSWSPVRSCWRPLEGSVPFLGQLNQLETADEWKVEVTVLPERLKETVAAVKQAHPYEEPVINVIPMMLLSK